ncbi:MAG: hypothetical protein ACPGEG_06270 [Salibacteraceae bacterium]
MEKAFLLKNNQAKDAIVNGMREVDWILLGVKSVITTRPKEISQT